MRKLIIGHQLLSNKMESFLIDYCRFMVMEGKRFWYLKGKDLAKSVGDIYISKPYLVAVSSFLPESIDDRSQDNLFAIQECGAENVLCSGSLVRQLLPAEMELINLSKYSRMKYIIENRDSIKLDIMLQSILAFDRDEIVFIESCFGHLNQTDTDYQSGNVGC